jgi:hypothetical protein
LKPIGLFSRVTLTVPVPFESVRAFAMVNFLALPLGSTPSAKLTPMPVFGFPWPQDRMVAGALPCGGPQPRREFAPIPRLPDQPCLPDPP